MTSTAESMSPTNRRTKYDAHHDDFPTPPWATRALLHYVIPDVIIRGTRIIEPAAGRGHIADVLREAGAKVRTNDIIKYPGCKLDTMRDYTDYGNKFAPYDLMITNPPFAQSNEFILRALQEASVGVAILMQSLWLVGMARYERVLRIHQPTTMAIFTRRMSATRGKLIRRGSAMMSHSWFYWSIGTSTKETKLILIPPAAQAELEKGSDYE